MSDGPSSSVPSSSGAERSGPSSAERGPFSRTALWVICGVAAASLTAAAALTVLGDDLDAGPPTTGADSYSRSAIGHAGLVALLEELDIPVARSRHDSAARAKGGLLVIAEPLAEDAAARDRLAAAVTRAERVLLVLPKWYGHAAPGDSWIESERLLLADFLDGVLEVVRAEGTLHRASAPVRLHTELAGLPLPRIREPQLLASGNLVPLVFDEDGGGTLLGRGTLEALGTELWILTDPDALNNHGLRSAENARFAVVLLERLREGGPVVFDEELHGYARPPSLARTLLRFPILLATLQGLACALLAVWAAMARFGPRRAAPPPIAPGKGFLIENTAALLHFGGHHAHALHRYLAQSVSQVRHALHAPDLPPAAMTAWLDRVGAARRALHGDSLAALERDAGLAHTPHRTLEVADRIHRWRMEMTHGARDSS